MSATLAMTKLLPTLPTFQFGNPNRCAYCGDPPSGRDHVIPVAYQRLYDASRLASNGPTTWACRICNSKLGPNWFDSFDERCRWIRDRIDRQAFAVEWASHEMARLDYGLRRYIVTENAKRIWQRNRADWYESRDYWLNLENLQWELGKFNSSNPGAKFLRDYFSPTLRFLKESLYR